MLRGPRIPEKKQPGVGVWCGDVEDGSGVTSLSQTVGDGERKIHTIAGALPTCAGSRCMVDEAEWHEPQNKPAPTLATWAVGCASVHSGGDTMSPAR